MIVFEDYEAVVKIMRTSRPMAIRHVLRNHLVAIDRLFDFSGGDDVFLW